MKQAIALAGGGTKGAYQVGAWKAMRELGIPFDIVTGTSIGSVTAALMVQGDFDRAWELWTHITEEQIMLERPMPRRTKSASWRRWPSTRSSSSRASGTGRISTAARRTFHRIARLCTNISMRSAFSPRRWISDS